MELLETVKSKNEKCFVYGSYLDPIVGQFKPSEDTETDEVNAKTARFYCLPYFSLDEFPSIAPASTQPQNGPRIHPVRTLLQTHYQLQSTKNRDERQVARKCNGSQKVIYVPQVWCLLVNNGKFYILEYIGSGILYFRTKLLSPCYHVCTRRYWRRIRRYNQDRKPIL